MKTLLKVLLITSLVPVILALLLTIRYYSGQKKIEKVNSLLCKKQISLTPVDRLLLTPIIDSQTVNPAYKTEDGVAYLVQTANNTVLFDVGYNKKDEKISPLLYNLDKMNTDLEQIDFIAISHAHVDHCGGISVMKEKKIKLANGPVDLQGKKIFSPAPLSCETGSVVTVTNPESLTEEIGSTGPLSVQMFATGQLMEQSLLINLKGKGLVVIIGCGHPQVETIIDAAEKITGIPVYAVIGGAHLYYTKVQDTFLRNIFGSSKLFCRSMTKAEVLSTIDFLKKAGVQKVYLSPHDSDLATQNLFASEYGANYETIKVGKKIEL